MDFLPPDRLRPGTLEPTPGYPQLGVISINTALESTLRKRQFIPCLRDRYHERTGKGDFTRNGTSRSSCALQSPRAGGYPLLSRWSDLDNNGTLRPIVVTDQGWRTWRARAPCSAREDIENWPFGVPASICGNTSKIRAPAISGTIWKSASSCTSISWKRARCCRTSIWRRSPRSEAAGPHSTQIRKTSSKIRTPECGSGLQPRCP